jgi:hypothetical protein
MNKPPEIVIVKLLNTSLDRYHNTDLRYALKFTPVNAFCGLDFLNEITEIFLRQVLPSGITQVKYRSPIIKMIYSVDMLFYRKYEVF